MLVNPISEFSATGVSDIFALAYAMSKLGYGNNPEMNMLWKIIDSKLDEEGRVIMDRTESKKNHNGASWKCKSFSYFISVDVSQV